ncbi:hypothetical protein GCM10007176_22500 [Salinicoccus roseus]|nr:hypothetical protein EDC33_2496 [Salinicoccus roseus]GGA77671.1 hypothetical protein GCM10007176_22500 [Salinicoccus roseus]
MIESELYHLNRENWQSGQYLKVVHLELKEFDQSGKIYRNFVCQNKLDKLIYISENLSLSC